MPNTFTTNYSLEKSEIGGDNSQWGSRIHTAFDTTDAQLINKLDKDNVKGFTSTAIIFTNTGASTGTISAASGDLFEDFEVNDKIKVSGATSATNGSTASPAEHTITAKTNSNSITVSTGLVDALVAGDSVTITLVTEIGRVDINSGTIDGATIATSDITVGSGKTLDVQSGTLTTSSTQKDEIVDGSTAITRSTNDLTFAGNVDVTGDVTVTGGDIKSSGGTTAISISGANTTLAGTTNNVGTVTAGTITSGVTQDGVPRLIKVFKITGSDAVSEDTKWTVGHDAVSFSATNNNTYIVQAFYSIFVQEDGPSLDGQFQGYIKLHYGTTNRTQETRQYTEFESDSYGKLVETEWHHGLTGQGSRYRFPVHMIGSFVANSTATHYVYPAIKSNAGIETIRMLFNTSASQCNSYIHIYEVTGVSITSHSSG